MTDILSALSWYLLVSLIGLAAFPLAFRYFPKLPSRGYAFSRPLGLLVSGFVFWLLGSLGVLQNDAGGIVIAYAVLIGIGAWAGFVKKAEIVDWLRKNLRTILNVEIIFLVGFGLWTLIRAMNPDAAYTEKPMELAFINAIIRSPSLPPQDPWLSGYSISYYYFGYILIAMLTRITGTVSAVAFNLTSSMWFALTAVASFGMVHDLIAVWYKQKNRDENHKQIDERYARLGGILGPIFVLVISTVEGVLEFLHAGGVFWKNDPQGNLVSKFWNWLAIADLNQAPRPPFNWIPHRDSGWLWWRGSRVLQDLHLSGSRIEIIDEFPFFSYLLSDLHPHVLAMPFALMAMAVCLNFFLGAKDFFKEHKIIQSWIRTWQFWLTALILGSMAFFNTWDFPIYVGLFCLVWGYSKYLLHGWKNSYLGEFIKNGLVLGFSGFLLFLPFYLGFQSQAGGLLPSLEFMTRGIHFWVLFGVLLVPIIIWLVASGTADKKTGHWRKSLQFTVIALLGMFLVSALFGLIIFSFQELGPSLLNSMNPLISWIGEKMQNGGIAFSYLHENSPASSVIQQSVLRRLQSPGTWLTLGVMLLFGWSLLTNRTSITTEENQDSQILSDKNVPFSIDKFVAILILVGTALTLFPEFFYLRDQFGSRMNTIFKFYFQAWIFWGISAAFCSVVLLQKLRKWKGLLFQIILVITMTVGLVYPALMLWDKTGNFSMKGLTLNGNAYIERYNPDEYAAITWLQSAPLGVIAEAVGGSYSEYARISTRSGMPTVLGWPGHESQWRGGVEEMGSRQSDIANLYQATQWSEALNIIQKYKIRYIYVSSLEQSSYRVNTVKFDTMLEVVYQNPSVMIYEVSSEQIQGH